MLRKERNKKKVIYRLNMVGNYHSKEEGISIIGVIPQYPKHSQHNIYAKVKMPPVGLESILSQISHDPRSVSYTHLTLPTN